LCTENACVLAYADDCVPDVTDPDAPNAKGVTIPSCDAGNIVDGDPCANADACAATEVAMLDSQGNLVTAQYDLSGLCKSQGYDYRMDTLSTEWYNINICGFAPKQCFPADCAPGTNGRTWKDGPCTPWVASANIGSVVRFFQANIDPAPATGTIGSQLSPPPHKQVSCYTDDGQPVQCTEACSILATSIIGADGVSVNWDFTNDTNDAGGLRAVGPSTAVSSDPSNPLGSESPTKQPVCQPTSEFSNGIETANIILKCDPNMKPNEAKVSSVDMIGCDYTITFVTGAVCNPTCPPNMGKCTSGPNKNFCMAICKSNGIGWFGTLSIVAIVFFSMYCLFGCCINKTYKGAWLMPHQPFWYGCKTCTCCRNSDDNSFSSVFDDNNNSSSSDNSSKFGDVRAHPDSRRSSYGTA
jgi:hypothetical protein